MRAGYATSKAEVIRTALAHLNEPQRYEDLTDDPELENYLKDVQKGKVKPKFVGTDSDIKKLLG